MYYTIKQMAKMFDVTEHTLRFLHRRGPAALRTGRRQPTVFNEESVNWMRESNVSKAAARQSRTFGNIADFAS